MKKILFILAFVGMSSGILYSQQSFELGFSTGTELNVPSSSNPQNIVGLQVRPGFNLAFRLQHNFNQRFSLLGGVEYGRMYWYRKGYSAIGFYNYHVIHSTNQIRLPMLFQLNIGKSRSKFYINSGIYLMATFNDEQNTTVYPFPIYDYELKTGAPNIVLPWNFGGILSAGYSYNIKPTIRFFAESRFLVPIVANPPYSTNFNTTRNLIISLSVGMSFTTVPKVKG